MTDGDITQWMNDVHQGDALEVLRKIPPSSVHCAVTSPPYYGLRDYDVDGQIGLEESLKEYISSIVEVADEVRRVLRPDGSFWLNIGDSFASKSGWGDQSGAVGGHDAGVDNDESSFPRKSKMLIPHRVAIALQERGWIVRQDNVWAKTDPTPNPVDDRHSTTKEYVFHLVPEPQYWFDLDAIREPHKQSSLERRERDGGTRGGEEQTGLPTQTGIHSNRLHPNGKNPGDIWEFSTCNFPEAHFAVFPRELPEQPIKATCPPKVCAVCGTPYDREVEEVPAWERDRSDIERPELRRALDIFDDSGLTEAHLEAARAKGFSDAAGGREQSGAGRNTDRTDEFAARAKDVLGGYFREMTMTGRRTGDWEQRCSCAVAGGYTRPGVVLDPFAGAGTTLRVAKDLGRRFVGIDLNSEYVAMAQKRVGVSVDRPELLDEVSDDQTPLLAYADGDGMDVETTDD